MIKFHKLNSMNKKVGIERCGSYNLEEVYSALKRAADLSGGFDVAGKTVLLKPNIVLDSDPKKAITTHPVFVEAAIRLTREMGAKRVLVGDSPAIQAPGFSGRTCGIGEVTKRAGAEWADFSKEKLELSCPGGKVVQKITVTKAAEEADVIISLPKLKTHQLMYFSGAIKNLFGLIPSVAKSSFHLRFPNREDLATMMVDICLGLKPTYAFMDAVVGMEGPGPTAGKPRFAGFVLASSNILAIDIAASQLIGYPPLSLPVNRDALSRGIWLSSIDEIEYPGLKPADLQIPDYVKVAMKKKSSLGILIPGPLRRWLDSFAPAPKINHSVCTRCGDCLKICSPRVMSFEEGGKNRRVTINYRGCIRCFCCHEVCPQNAIDIVKNPKNL